MTRQEYLEWAKQRAFEQIDQYSGLAGWLSFKHDLQKHPETADHIAIGLGDEIVKMAVAGCADNLDQLLILDAPGPMNIRRFIEGFN